MRFPIKFFKKLSASKLLTILVLLSLVQTLYVDYLKKEYNDLSNQKIDLQRSKSKVEKSLTSLISKKAISILVHEQNSNLTYFDALAISDIIYEQSIALGFDPLLVASVIITESSFKPDARSHKGAIGLMQIKPSTANYIAGIINYDKKVSELDLRNYEQNIVLGVNYLKHLIDKFDGSVEKGLIAYNLGEWKVSQKLKKGERLPTRYLDKVNKYYNKMNKDFKEIKQNYNTLLPEFASIG